MDRTDEFHALANKRPHSKRPKLASAHANLDRALHALRAGTLPQSQTLAIVHNEFARAQDEAVNNQERLHWCEAARIFESQTVLPIVRRPLGELTRIEAQLHVVSELYAVVLRLLQQQSGKLTLVERNVDAIQVRIDASADHLADMAPRTYRARPWYWVFVPRSLTACLRCAVIAVLLGNLALICWLF